MSLNLYVPIFFNCSELKNNEFDVVISPDVIEHIAPTMEDKFCELMNSSLRTDGIAVIGTPSIMMSPYTREENKIAHINLYDQKRLYELMSKYFRNVFIFNMNDEIVNVSFAHGMLYLCSLL